MNSINSIKIKLSNTEEKEEIFCIGKGTFVNFRKKKRLEKYVIFMSEFQINFFSEINEIFIDGT